MKLPAKITVWVLPLFLSGCFLHKTEKLPPQPVAPPIPDSKLPPPAQDPPPEVTIPTKQPVSDTKLPVETPKPPPSKHRKPAPAPADNQEASAGTPEQPAIGVITMGDPGDARSQTEQSIAATERGVNGLNRQLSDPEKKTVSHIREFIKQAKVALASGDVDGASTLAAKAKVLLTELVH
jgi:outer membrane biosynthesis protein TonB